MGEGTVLYINSYMRSGSTLLGMLVHTQTGMAYVGEVRNFQEAWDKNSCYCGLTLHHCPFWGDVFSYLDDDPLMLRTKMPSNFLQDKISHKLLKYACLMNFPVKYIKLFSHFSRSIQKELDATDNVLKIYNAVLCLPQSRIVCDSSHRDTQAKLLSYRLGDRLKIIHLVRDGRGVVNSVIKRTGCTVQKASKAWKRYNRVSGIFHRNFLPKNILKVKYEDICTSPEVEVKRICDFTEVPFSSEALQQKMDWHFVGGSAGLKRKRYKKVILDESWKKELSPQDLKIFNKIAGKLNQKYGYQ